MAIHKLTSQSGFTKISNSVLYMPDLSPKAKLTLFYLTSKTPDWEVFIIDIANNLGIGQKATQKAIRELEKFGFIKKIKIRHSNGQIGGIKYDVYPEPQHFQPQGQKPPAVNRPDGKPPAVKGALIRKNIRKKEEPKKEVSNEPSKNAAAISFEIAKRALKVFCDPSDKIVNQVLSLVHNPNKFKSMHNDQTFKFNTIIKHYRDGKLNLNLECNDSPELHKGPKRDFKVSPANAIRKDIEGKEINLKRVRGYGMDVTGYEEEIACLKKKLEAEENNVDATNVQVIEGVA